MRVTNVTLDRCEAHALRIVHHFSMIYDTFCMGSCSSLGLVLQRPIPQGVHGLVVGMLFSVTEIQLNKRHARVHAAHGVYGEAEIISLQACIHFRPSFD